VGTERKLEYRRLDKVLPADANPKGHNIPLIRESIEARGFVDGLIEDGRTGKLVGGHGRLIALQLMQEEGQDAPEGIRPDGDGVWMVPVQVGWASRSDAEARAVLIALNRTTELGGWDEAALGSFLSELLEDGELTGTGFNEHDLLGFGSGEAPGGGFGDDPPGAKEPQRWTCPKCGFSWSV